MKPLVSYYGGKQRIASKIVPLLPPHTVYAEPFAGGCAVMFEKGLPAVTNKDHYREAINDINENVVALYRVARDHPADLQRVIEGTPYAKSEYKRAVEIYKNPAGHSPLWIAWATYINLNWSFANKANAGFSTGRSSENAPETNIKNLKRRRLSPQSIYPNLGLFRSLAEYRKSSHPRFHYL